MARLPGLRNRMSKAEQLELELARQGSIERLERLLAERAAGPAGPHVPAEEPDLAGGPSADAGAPDGWADEALLLLGGSVPDAGEDGRGPAGLDGEGSLALVPVLFEGVGRPLDWADDEAGADDATEDAVAADQTDQADQAWPGVPVMDATAGIPVMRAVPGSARQTGRRAAPVSFLDEDWDADQAASSEASRESGADMDVAGAAALDATDAAGSSIGEPPSEGGAIDAGAETPATPRRGRRRGAERETPPPPPRATAARPTPAHPRRAPRRRQPPVLAACPSCAVLLDPAPTASRRCAVCRERIVVRRLEKGVLYLTAAAAERLASAQRQQTETTRHMAVRDRWLALAVEIGAPAPALRRVVARPATQDAVDAARVIYVRAAERAATEAHRARRFTDVAAIRRSLASAIHRADGSPVPAPEAVLDSLVDAAAADLRALRGPGRRARIAAGGCCPRCAEDDGYVGRVSDEQRLLRLPHVDCGRGRCRCRWTAVRPAPVAKPAPKGRGASAKGRTGAKAASKAAATKAASKRAGATGASTPAAKGAANAATAKGTATRRAAANETTATGAATKAAPAKAGAAKAASATGRPRATAAATGPAAAPGTTPTAPRRPRARVVPAVDPVPAIDTTPAPEPAGVPG